MLPAETETETRSSVATSQHSKQYVDEDEIDLIEVAKSIWDRRKLISKISLVTLVIGIFYAFTTPAEYTSISVVLPESDESSMMDLGGLGGLAGLAGIDMAALGGKGSFSPELYPKVLESTPFQLELIETPIYFESLGRKIPLRNYFEEHAPVNVSDIIIQYTFGLPFQLVKLFKDERKLKAADENYIKLTEDEAKLLDDLKDRITIESDKKNGLINISVEMPDAYASAEVNGLVVRALTDFVIDYQVQKQKKNVDFIKERYLEAKGQYEGLQEKMAKYTDSHRNIITADANLEKQRLEFDLNLAFSVYSGLTNQLEQAEIKLKEETPVFTVLSPGEIPYKKSAPRKGMILISSVFIGIVLGIIIVFFNNLFNNLKGQW
ncbi:Wzz/FepE/Etk N-terminal domain-containing protein [Aureibacter tunicatorum]|uniref:Uncharacterized protein involved in exopolysaccharide biosynthesis n=1 Tax=Aureibacter tunicatorum TaxID=866807 RepID=A0AAE3XQF7_9BACT|nr:Wzz/FepE/Etk N-terminal domain-containing protein [Aureibacter tunicatorum]MDR6240149.1 uncharacterized protein involved in exopolysaccharide biosynthesis [Aureibacter tunicatorum]BDD05970.1 chain-length determining protein [Aureibacter tunicatorum]